ncbi:hypothetical protein LEMLEM_LOCUS27544 [Lemmus lemmus]
MPPLTELLTPQPLISSLHISKQQKGAVGRWRREQGLPAPSLGGVQQNLTKKLWTPAVPCEPMIKEMIVSYSILDTPCALSKFDAECGRALVWKVCRGQGTYALTLTAPQPPSSPVVSLHPHLPADTLTKVALEKDLLCCFNFSACLIGLVHLEHSASPEQVSSPVASRWQHSPKQGSGKRSP